MWNQLVENISLARIEHVGEYFKKFPKAMDLIKKGFDELDKDLTNQDFAYQKLKSSNLERKRLRLIQFEKIQSKLKKFNMQGDTKWREILESLNEKRPNYVKKRIQSNPQLKQKIDEGLQRLREMIFSDPTDIQILRPKQEYDRFNQIWDKIKNGEEHFIKPLPEQIGSPEFDDDYFFVKLRTLKEYNEFLAKCKKKYIDSIKDPKNSEEYKWEHQNDFLNVNHG